MEPEVSPAAVTLVDGVPKESEICFDNVEHLYHLIDKHVKVDMIKNYSYCGFVHAIDPVTKSIILSIPNQDTYQTMLIPGHAVTNITETSPTTFSKPIRKQDSLISEEELTKRKEITLNWLTKHLLPAKEGNSVIDIGNVSILAPYTTKDICASNPVVVEQMKKILDSMPNRYW